MKGLSFTADGGFFAVDVTLVQKVARNLELTPVPAAPNAVIGIANMKGRVITVLSLSALLGQTREKYTEKICAVIFKSDDGEQMGLLIDKPGSLIDIDEDKIITPALLPGTEEEKFCVSGAIEAGAENKTRLYRIIDIDLIINKFKYA